MWHSPKGRQLGTGKSLYVIAEIGLNHGGSVDRALAMVDEAAAAGASAVKLQSLTAGELVAPSCPAPAHVNATSLQDFFARFELDAAAHAAIVARARARGVAVMTTPFSETLIPGLEAIGFDAYKVASGDLTNHSLLAALARTRKPLVISTGMAGLEDVRRAVQVVRGHGGTVAAVLHCVSAYPTPPEAQNLLALRTIATVVDAPVGLSDHAADGLVSAVAAVALGASVYERHVRLEGDTTAIDAAVSSTPRQLRAIVAACADLVERLGDGQKRCQPAEAVDRTASRRGVYARRDLVAGQIIGPDDLIALRPETAVPASALPFLVGSLVTRAIAAGEPIQESDMGRRAA